MKCSNCGTEIPGGTMTCPNCGCKIDPRAMFHTVKDESGEPDNSAGRPVIPVPVVPGHDAGRPANPEPARPGYDAGRPASPEPVRPGYDAGRPASPEPVRPGYDAGRPASPEPVRPGYGAGRPANPEPVRPGYDPGYGAGYGAGRPANPGAARPGYDLGYDMGMDEPTVREPMYTPRPAADIPDYPRRTPTEMPEKDPLGGLGKIGSKAAGKASAALSGAAGAAGGAIGGALGKAGSGRKLDKRILAIGAVVILLLGVLVFKVLAKDPIIGTWEATEFIENGMSYSPEELGDEGGRLVFGENHTVVFSVINLYDGSQTDSLSGRWDKISRGEYTVTLSAVLETGSVDVSLSGGTLTMYIDSQQIIFKKR